MNVLFLTSTFPRYRNDGQAPFVLEQARAWKNSKPDDKIFILAPHDQNIRREEDLDGIRIYRFVYWWPQHCQKLAYPAILPNIRRNPLLIVQVPFLIFCELLAALKIIRKHQINLVFAHWIMPQGLIAYFVHKMRHIPYGLKNYSSDLRVFHKIPVLGPLLARKIIENSRVMFCENSMLKDEALKLFSDNQRSGLADKIVALSMGVFQDPSIHPVERPSPGERIYDFGFIGRLTKKKGLNFFIDAIRRLKAEGLPCKVVIAGEGEERTALEYQSSGLDIEFIGFVSQEAKNKFFQQTKVIVFPSTNVQGDIEGLPVALLEALCQGKLTLASQATNIELLPEWPKIKNSLLLLNNPAETDEFVALLKTALQTEKDFYSRTSEQLKENLTRYHWKNLIQEYIRPLTKPANPQKILT